MLHVPEWFLLDCGLRRRAGCREERLQPPDPFRILKPSELAPLKPVKIEAMGYYAYKITWSDGHDTGIYTIDNLRALCQCERCQK